MQVQLRPIVLAVSLAAVSHWALAAVGYVDVRTAGIYGNDGRIVVEAVNNRYAKVVSPEANYNVEMKAGCKPTTSWHNTAVSACNARLEQRLAKGESYQRTGKGTEP